MRVATLSTALLAALPLASAELDKWAKKAGLKYFGAATDSPGQRERAGYEAVYPQYDEIMWESGEFHQTTPTNGMKWLFTEPQRGVYNFTEGEIVASRANAERYVLRCHALVWHSQLAPWVTATNWTKDELKTIIHDHITNVMGHWKGRCYAWDVVNEALNEDGTYRSSVFYDTLGEDFIKYAFQVAHETDPNAKLYYNDYNLEYPGAKVSGAARIVSMLQNAGIHIDGVGLQSHLTAEGHPTIDQHIDAISTFTRLGVEVALTELDVRLTLPATPALLAKQSQGYKNIVGACAQVKGCIGVTIWDFYDPFSWVPATFAGQGLPLLWYANFTKHPAYYGVLAALKNATGACSKTHKRSIPLLD
ncbi:hypothetical protein DL546_002220 [Coniochaeta pulveracea]|uniref:Beta-xylanase n=1 Tax=Coniochaeta pulveracea TaxID=177199 RepID=A0A420XX29_9PEZI|nr:hypothetical protein DL546_002220 [Coniochaeta pulveracea]